MIELAVFFHQPGVPCRLHTDLDWLTDSWDRHEVQTKCPLIIGTLWTVLVSWPNKSRSKKVTQFTVFLPEQLTIPPIQHLGVTYPQVSVFSRDFRKYSNPSSVHNAEHCRFAEAWSVTYYAFTSWWEISCIKPQLPYNNKGWTKNVRSHTELIQCLEVRAQYNNWSFFLNQQRLGDHDGRRWHSLNLVIKAGPRNWL